MPSSGSTIQRSPLCRASSPPSSPSIAVVRPARRRGGRGSAARPRVGLGDEVGRAALGVTIRSSASNAARSCAPAARATASASARSCDHSAGARGPPTAGAASSWAASESSVASSPGRPTSCTASGKPSSVKPAGTDAAGWPVWLNGRAVRDEARPKPLNVHSRAAALVACRSAVGRGEHRRQQDVGVARRRGCSRARVGGLLRPRPRDAAARGIAPADAAEALGAAREPLGVRQRRAPRRRRRGGSAR